MAEPRVAGRLALVTGAGRGIGLATARALGQAGAELVLVDRDEGSAKQAADRLRSEGLRAEPWTVDVCEAQAFEEMVQEIEARGKPVDILVNNAGVMCLGSFLDVEPTADRRQLDVNVHGVIHGMRAVLPSMIERGQGHVVNVASAAGRIGVPFAATYSASKHAVVGLTESVRRELDGSGVSFTYVLPSLVDTELISGAGRPLFPPVVKAEDVAQAVVDAIERQRVQVFVPRFARLSAVLPAFLPRRVYEALGRILRLDRMFADVDGKARAKYERRALAD